MNVIVAARQYGNKYLAFISHGTEDGMRKLAILGVLLLAACGSGVTGTYQDESGMTSYTFKPGGKVVVSAMGTEMELDYEVEGDRIKVGAGAGNVVLTRLEDGSIRGPMGISLSKVEE